MLIYRYIRLFNFCYLQTRLQAQAAGVAYSHPLSNLISRMAYFGPRTVCIPCHFLVSLKQFRVNMC